MKRLSLALLSILLLGGCSASGPLFTELETPAEDESIIYFLRAKNYYGGGVFYTVHENGKPVCKLYNGGYYPHHTTPGEKLIEATTEVTSDLVLLAEKGKRHYVYGDVSMGLFIEHPQLHEIDEEEALRYLHECHLLEPIKAETENKELNATPVGAQ